MPNVFVAVYLLDESDIATPSAFVVSPNAHRFETGNFGVQGVPTEKSLSGGRLLTGMKCRSSGKFLKVYVGYFIQLEIRTR